MVSSNASTAALPKPSAGSPNAAAHGVPSLAMPIATPSSTDSWLITIAPVLNASPTLLPWKLLPISRDQTLSQGRHDADSVFKQLTQLRDLADACARVLL